MLPQCQARWEGKVPETLTTSQPFLGFSASICITWIVQKTIWTGCHELAVPMAVWQQQKQFPLGERCSGWSLSKVIHKQFFKTEAASLQHKLIDILPLRTRHAWKCLQGIESCKSDPADLRKMEPVKITNHNQKLYGQIRQIWWGSANNSWTSRRNFPEGQIIQKCSTEGQTGKMGEMKRG